MSRELTIIVPPGKVRGRLDIFLTHHVENATRSKVQKAIEGGYVLVDGKKVKPSHKVSPGETIHVVIPKPPPQEVVPENIPLDIIHEDDVLLVVNKPAGMVTHPAYGNYTGTLVNALLYHCNGHLSKIQQSINPLLPAPARPMTGWRTTVQRPSLVRSVGQQSNSFTRPGIVHRLDKDTSGLMVIAKDDATHAKLARQFSQRTIEREYWALVWGLFKKPKGVIEASLGRSKSDRKKITVTSGGKQAMTEYEVLERFEYLSLVRLKLLTGRTHQIRVHLHHIGHPVFGDPTYGGRRIVFQPHGSGAKLKQQVQKLLDMIDRQALHAKTLGFVHPLSEKFMKFDSELPADFRAVLGAVKK
jgi:23S rRNA pseudouridine1911/1915/1917 synthase